MNWDGLWYPTRKLALAMSTQIAAPIEETVEDEDLLEIFNIANI